MAKAIAKQNKVAKAGPKPSKRKDTGANDAP